MSVYDCLTTVNDLSNVVVTIWDCDSERVVFDSGNDDVDDIPSAVDELGLGDYEVYSCDLYKDEKNQRVLELNISMGEGE